MGTDVEPSRIRAAWEGRISGCMLGKPVELLSMMRGKAALDAYLQEADALPLRDYVPQTASGSEESRLVERFGAGCTRDQLSAAVRDDDIDYTVLALMLLEEKGAGFTTEDVARSWLLRLPAGATYTAERAAYRILLYHCAEHFANGAPAGFDLSLCSDNEYNDWIGAQIRADLYGWVCPGNPELAADLARRDAELSHRDAGVHGAMFVAAMGAALASAPLDGALDAAQAQLPSDSEAVAAIRFGLECVGAEDGALRLHARYAELSPVHTVNNLALVVWALASSPGDFGAAIGEAVAAGWDTDCNGATVGGLYGIAGARIPPAWTKPWGGRVGVGLSGLSELALDDLVERTIAVARGLS